MKSKCSKCGYELKDKINNKILKKRGIKKRTNYPHGKKSKGITTMFCSCGGVFTNEEPPRKLF